ncbi:MAG: 50S ribosomal protein L5 [Candidatus Pacebacteria bacterium]|nr:50S ribosomal protein L5 [Candidatus Paceibacterota bacterium]
MKKETFETMKEKAGHAFTSLKEALHIKNAMQTPHIEKVVVNVGFGSTKDKKKIELIAERLSRITGQKPATRTAKKSIATYKTRTGDPLAYQVTLRGARMYDFLDRLVHIALPRTKDFRGLSRTIDEMGNYTLGIKEHTIFPETADEDLKDVFGLAITLVTTSKDKNHTIALLEYLGFPLKKENAVIDAPVEKAMSADRQAKKK